MAEAPTLVIATDDYDEIVSELVRLETVYVLWETWIGTNGLAYARRLKSSPPIVVKADNTAALWEHVREEERQIAVRQGRGTL